MEIDKSKLSPEVALLTEGVDRNVKSHLEPIWQQASPSSRRAWIEIPLRGQQGCGRRSPSSRRAWIEMICPAGQWGGVAVALLTEGVDRNWLHQRCRPKSKRSPSSRRAWIEMDDVARQEALRKVALLTEGVDRNICSPKVPNILRVALLTEGVDRNTNAQQRAAAAITSPSSRRAWIEIVGVA